VPLPSSEKLASSAPISFATRALPQPLELIGMPIVIIWHRKVVAKAKAARLGALT
jgi:hypothetical protein